MMRVDRQLASGISIITAACHESESLLSQQLAEDLHKALAELKRIHAGIGEKGQRYRAL
jgi:hypothetical protein